MWCYVCGAVFQGVPVRNAARDGNSSDDEDWPDEGYYDASVITPDEMLWLENVQILGALQGTTQPALWRMAAHVGNNVYTMDWTDDTIITVSTQSKTLTPGHRNCFKLIAFAVEYIFLERGVEYSYDHTVLAKAIFDCFSTYQKDANGRGFVNFNYGSKNIHDFQEEAGWRCFPGFEVGFRGCIPFISSDIWQYLLSSPMYSESLEDFLSKNVPRRGSPASDIGQPKSQLLPMPPATSESQSSPSLTPNGLDRLPPELLEEVLIYLRNSEVWAFRLACRAAAMTPLGQAFWKSRFSEANMPYFFEQDNLFANDARGLDWRALWHTLHGKDRTRWIGWRNRLRIWKICCRIARDIYAQSLTQDAKGRLEASPGIEMMTNEDPGYEDIVTEDLVLDPEKEEIVRIATLHRNSSPAGKPESVLYGLDVDIREKGNQVVKTHTFGIAESRQAATPAGEIAVTSPIASISLASTHAAGVQNDKGWPATCITGLQVLSNGPSLGSGAMHQPLYASDPARLRGFRMSFHPLRGLVSFSFLDDPPQTHPPQDSLVRWAGSLPPSGLQIHRRSGAPLTLPNSNPPTFKLVIFSPGSALALRVNARGKFAGIELAATATAAALTLASDERVTAFTAFFEDEPFGGQHLSDSATDPLWKLRGRMVDMEFETDRGRKSQRLLKVEEEEELKRRGRLQWMKFGDDLKSGEQLVGCYIDASAVVKGIGLVTERV